MKSKICSVCGKEFVASTKYCSKHCQHLSMRTYNYDVTNPPKCLNCSEILSHKLANGNYKFCCLNCRKQFLEKEKQLKINNSNNQFCEICGNLLLDKQILNKRRVCSAKCAYELRVILYGAVSDKNPDKFVQYAITNELRKDEAYCKSHSDFLRNLWKQDDFRAKKIVYMNTNNPVYKDGVVEKANKTKEKHGNLHIWASVRGGNGKISECEALLYDFCTENGFLYNKAINTYALRKQYPDKHYGFNYKPDFTNIDYKICVEVDGSGHYSEKGRQIDAKKEFCLTTLGYTILRFSNVDVKTNLENVKQTILNALYEKGYKHG